MTRALRIREARASDEAALRELTESGMEGAIRLAFPQRPDFFAAERIRGETRIGILTDDSDAVLGCGARVVRTAWFKGDWRRTGYYCTLRAHKAGQNVRAVKAAYTWAREVEQADPLPVLTSTILSGNERARRLLTSRRFGLPAYLDAGEITTFTTTRKALRRFGAPASFDILSGTDLGENALRAFLANPDHLQPLFPVLPDPLPPGLALDDFIVLRQGGRILAAAALWNQRSLRQVRVLGYSLGLRVLRPFANVLCSFGGLPRLPHAGDELNLRYLAFRRAVSNDPALLAGLLRAAADRLDTGEVLSFSVHAQDPLINQLKHLRAVRTASRLYTLSYAQDPQPVDFGDAPYIEAALL